MPPILIRNALHPQFQHLLLLADRGAVHEPAPPLMELIGTFTDDGNGGLIAAAYSTSGCGYIDGYGKWVVEPVLQDVRAFSDDGLARFQADGLWGYLDLNGTIVVPPSFAEAGAFRHGLAPVVVGEQWRYIDRTGAFAFEAAFSWAGNFSEAGLAFARDPRSSKIGFIDTSGNWAIRPQFCYRSDFSRHGVAPAALNERKCGIIDTNGKWIVEPRYSLIGDFDETGHAWCADHEGYGYLDTSGREVIPPDRYLERYMADGLVRKAWYEFVGVGGPLATSVRPVWADHFTGHGFTVACVKHASAPGVDAAAIRWGILRADGQFQPAPDDVLEPLTAAQFALRRPEPGTPLVPFLTRDHEIALLDRNGAIVYRLRREHDGAMANIVLHDAAGALLWRSRPLEQTARPERFFAPVSGQFLEGVADAAQVIDMAESLLAQTRAKLAQLASGELQRADDEGTDYYGTQEQDEDNWPSSEDGFDDEDPCGPAAAVKSSRRVFRTFMDEPTWGSYYYLSEVHLALMRQTHEDMLAHLVRHFGPCTSGPDYAVPGADESTSAWAFGEEPQRLWLGIKPVFETSGGAVWCHIWLHCAPSLATLQAALDATPVSWARDEDDE